MTRGTPRADFDLVIVGAGFAGLVCARTAAMRGMRVAVLEREPHSGARVRTTGILVKEAADALDLPVELTRKLRRVRLYAPSMASIDLHSPGYYFLATDTPRLLRWLARQAQAAGAQLFYRESFSGAARQAGWLRLAGLDLTTRYLVGADGVRSPVAACFGLGRNRRFLVGVEAAFAGDGGIDGGFLHCFVDHRLAPGYIAWAVPGVGVIQVGLARTLPGKPDLHGLIEKLRPILDLTAAPRLGLRTGLIPIGGPVRPIATERVLLIGDAAGLVSPMTAGGIHNAFHFGRRAAQAISDHLFDHGPEPGPCWRRRFRTPA